MSCHPLSRLSLSVVLLSLAGTAACNPANLIFQNKVIEADLFSPRPEMLSAGYGFEGIIGVAGGEAEVRAAGGAWNQVTCKNGEEPPRRVLTSSVEPNEGLDLTRADAMPIVFSWPLVPDTLATTDFSVLLNDGSRVTPDMAVKGEGGARGCRAAEYGPPTK